MTRPSLSLIATDLTEATKKYSHLVNRVVLSASFWAGNIYSACYKGSNDICVISLMFTQITYRLSTQPFKCMVDMDISRIILLNNI